MNAGINLIKAVCNLTNRENYADNIIAAYEKTEKKPDNFVPNITYRLVTTLPHSSLEDILKVYYDSTFRFPESVVCEGSLKLEEFLNGIDGENEKIGEVIEELDKIANENGFFDENGVISDDEKIRIIRNQKVIYDLYVMENGTVVGKDEFCKGIYKDGAKVRELLENSDADDGYELWSEWLACNNVSA